eukprot:15467951-Alexandrium_andersonii.AAC.1
MHAHAFVCTHARKCVRGAGLVGCAGTFMLVEAVPLMLRRSISHATSVNGTGSYILRPRSNR